MSLDLLGSATAFLLTVCIFSYLLGDNPFYRLAAHLFVGVAAGYVAIIAIQSVLLPRFSTVVVAFPALLGGDPLPFAIAVIPVLLSVMVFLKLDARFAPYGNAALAFMVGVGAAVAISGAISGTLFPQVQASWVNPLAGAGGGLGFIVNTVNAGLVLLATLLALMYFFYSGQKLPGGRGDRPGWMKPIAAGGEVFITIALAALYAGALAASFALLADRVAFMYQFILRDAPEVLKAFGL